MSQNKRKKSIIFLGLGLLLVGLFLSFQIVQGHVGKDFLKVSLSQNLRSHEGEQLFELKLSWPLLDITKYDEILIKIDEDEFTLPSTETRFETFLTEADTDYQIEFRGVRKGFGLDKKAKRMVRTLGSDVVLGQSIANLKMLGDYLSFEHTLTQLPDDFDKSSVRYELTDFWQQNFAMIETKLLKEEAGMGIFKVTVPLADFLDRPSLSLSIHADRGDVSFFAPVTDTIEQEVHNFETSRADFTLYLTNGQFVLLNNQVEYLSYKNHTFFAESSHIRVQEADELHAYQLVNMEGETVVDQLYQQSANGGIDLSGLLEGRYFVLLNEKLLRIDEDIDSVWYTVTRNGHANKNRVRNLNGLLAIDVKKVNELPHEVYDLLLDAGHGGLDGGATGNGLREADEVLKVSKYMAKRFEDHGLKVKLTRTGDYEPSGDETFDGIRSPYYENGRVAQVYQHQAKFMISSHLNAFNGSLEGFEVFSSIFTSDDWSQLVVSNLMQANHIPRDSINGQGRVSPASFKREADCKRLKVHHQLFTCTEPSLDKFYVIRETGGPMTFSSELLFFNPEIMGETPNFGAETILVEFGYIDHVNDAMNWNRDWKVWGESVVKATLEHLNIEYQGI